jgi:hypothetical protein
VVLSPISRTDSPSCQASVAALSQVAADSASHTLTAVPSATVAGAIASLKVTAYTERLQAISVNTVKPIAQDLEARGLPEEAKKLNGLAKGLQKAIDDLRGQAFKSEGRFYTKAKDAKEGLARLEKLRSEMQDTVVAAWRKAQAKEGEKVTRMRREEDIRIHKKKSW